MNVDRVGGIIFGLGGMMMLVAGAAMLTGWPGGILALGAAMLVIWHGRASPLQ